MPTWVIVLLVVLTIAILQKVLELEEKIEELESRLDDVEPVTYDEDDNY